jgi:hypothetical protein
MGAFKKKGPFWKVCQKFHDLFAGKPFSVPVSQTVYDSFDILAGLETTYEPGPDIRKTLIVEIDRILRTEYNTDTVGPCLFEQRNHGFFGRWVFHRREKSVYLIHIKEGAQAGGTALHPHPGYIVDRATPTNLPY